MIYQWILPSEVDESGISEIVQNYKIHPIISRILCNRQLTTEEKITKFFNKNLDQLYDPYLLDGMQVAVERIILALSEGENILIYGDYDVDGVTSVSILYDGLFRLGGKVSFFIPDRFKEGYGVSREGILVAKNRQVSLVITVDCGITAIDEIKFAKEEGIDVIVCDHHEPGDALPDAVAVLDPKLEGSVYPCKELAGCGVAFKLLQALTQKLGFVKNFAYQYLDLVALGTAADIVQLMDENRIMARNGLERINAKPRPGIYALLESCSLLRRKLTVSTIVFVLAPRINAVGRISNAKKAVHLLTTNSVQQGRNISRILENENRTRKNIDEITFHDAQEMIEREIDIESKRILVLAKEDWHTGVVGIVASRIMEKYSRPTVLISIQDGEGKGSARSTRNFNIYAAFKKLEHLLINFGGHRFAAGLTIKPENIRLLDEEINKLSQEELNLDDMVPTLDIDAEIGLEQLTASFFNDLKSLAPFGPGNMRPVFVSYDLQIYGRVTIVGNNHLKMKFKQNSVVVDAIGYNLGEYIDLLKKDYAQLNCAYVIEESNWNGQTTIQMRIKDFEVIKND